MSSREQIVDTPLPANRNFEELKRRGLDTLLHWIGKEWTDFNESDPGVTILEQLCYALTELGYCQNFPIEDILTKSNGQLSIKGQFYLPTQILTTTPVTLLDYRKLLIDRLPKVKNAYIDVDEIKNGDTVLRTGGLQVYLLLDYRAFYAGVHSCAKELEREKMSGGLEWEARQLLNEHRNLGQWFLPPKVLLPHKIQITGTVFVADQVMVSDIHNRILLALDQYVSPTVGQYGYQALVEKGFTSDAIFNGPELLHGWIPDRELSAPKRTWVSCEAVAGLLSSLPGINSVRDIRLESASTPAKQKSPVDTKEGGISIATTEVAHFLLDNLHLEVSPGASRVSSIEQRLALELQMLQQKRPMEQIDAIQLVPELPKGRYRNIAEYYPVQNTFPLDYGIGPGSVPAGSSSYRLAQARQLKGYLMVFDQLLANQFSQLAEVAQLFSFQEAPTVVDDPKESYSGIPYQLFSPTYFCQPLYKVPDVKPLLLGNDMFRFSSEPITTPEQHEKIWQQYQKDPFNRYMLGLRQAMETDDVRDERRSRMLDHLLARHGLSPAWLDNIIHTARWYSSTVKTRIIVKSLLLQNVQAFSYHRPKGYSNLMADRIGTVGRFRLTREGFHHLGKFDLSSGLLSRFVNVGYSSDKEILEDILKDKVLKKRRQKWDEVKRKCFEKLCLIIEDNRKHALKNADALWSDGQLNLDALSEETYFRPKDFTNFAAVELQINLLLGLKQHYQWLAQLLALLLTSDAFSRWVIKGNGTFHLLEHDPDLQLDLRVGRKPCEPSKDPKAVKIDTVSFGPQAPMLKIVGKDGHAPTLSLYQAHLDQIQWLSEQRQGGLLLEPVLWLTQVGNPRSKDDPQQTVAPKVLKRISESDCFLRTFYLLPEYVCLFREETFLNTLQEVIATYWPLPVTNTYFPCDFHKFKEIIQDYIVWQNNQLNPADLSEKEAYKEQEQALHGLAREVLGLTFDEKGNNTPGVIDDNNDPNDSQGG